LPPTLYLGTGLIFISFVVALLLRFVLRASLVNVEVLCAGIVIFLMWGWSGLLLLKSFWESIIGAMSRARTTSASQFVVSCSTKNFAEL